MSAPEQTTDPAQAALLILHPGRTYGNTDAYLVARAYLDLEARLARLTRLARHATDDLSPTELHDALDALASELNSQEQPPVAPTARAPVTVFADDDDSALVERESDDD